MLAQVVKEEEQRKRNQSAPAVMAVVSPHSRSARFFVLSPDRGLDRLEQLRRKHFDPEH